MYSNDEFSFSPEELSELSAVNGYIANALKAGVPITAMVIYLYLFEKTGMAVFCVDPSSLATKLGLRENGKNPNNRVLRALAALAEAGCIEEVGQHDPKRYRCCVDTTVEAEEAALDNGGVIQI